jgi:hypothetical protein
MAVSITKIGSSIKIDNGINPVYYPVEYITHKVLNDCLFIYYRDQQIRNYKNADIIEPAAGDIEGVADKIAILLQDNVILISDVEALLSDLKTLQEATATQLKINNKILSESFSHVLYTESDLNN